MDGTKAQWGYHAKHIDIGWVKLPAPLQPGGSVTISTPFRVKIPDGKFSRLGHSKQAYYITQWYPKPAVFDATGWHAMPYLTQGEFYSEFGSFDVSITLPANYVVGATGLLQDARERAWMDSLAAVPYSETQKFYLDKQRVKLNAFPPSSERTKTIRYMQDRVHDFAWFADKRFIVRKSSVTLPRSGKSVTTWAMCTPKNALLWSDAVSYVNESVRFYSEHVGDYPYDACTAIDGTISAGGGMEYPMITVIGNMGDKQSLDNVIAHEVGHNWFYGILGSNERDHAWMDEGMNSFLELRYMRMRYPGSGFSIGIPGLKKAASHLSDPHRAQSELAYRLNARRNLDQSLSLSSDEFTSTNYGTCVYMKSALIMDHLMAYLGEEVMDKCLRAYHDEWKFKHPRPEDMRKVFERESDKNLGWVFNGFIGTDVKYRVKAVSLDRRTWAGTEERWNLGHRAKGPTAGSLPHYWICWQRQLGNDMGMEPRLRPPRPHRVRRAALAQRRSCPHRRWQPHARHRPPQQHRACAWHLQATRATEIRVDVRHRAQQCQQRVLLRAALVERPRRLASGPELAQHHLPQSAHRMGGGAAVGLGQRALGGGSAHRAPLRPHPQFVVPQHPPRLRGALLRIAARSQGRSMVREVFAQRALRCEASARKAVGTQRESARRADLHHQ
ncbi:MAG: hypothetical protein IPJ85_02960 [Flavobacteriales bacterium]|nr:hypothetical protein [Flavobacteriales bacterium]